MVCGRGRCPHRSHGIRAGGTAFGGVLVVDPFAGLSRPKDELDAVLATPALDVVDDAILGHVDGARARLRDAGLEGAVLLRDRLPRWAAVQSWAARHCTNLATHDVNREQVPDEAVTSKLRSCACEGDFVTVGRPSRIDIRAVRRL